eukprot:1316440-Prymnesium_polylepis.1
MRRAPHSSTTSPSGCSCINYAGSGLEHPHGVTCGARDNDPSSTCTVAGGSASSAAAGRAGAL